MVSSTCSIISRCESAPVTSSRRSASVDLPWSMCAMIEKLRMNSRSMRYDGERSARLSHMPGVTLIHNVLQHILFEWTTTGLRCVTVNRPEKLNALSGAVVAGIERRLRADRRRRRDPRGLILTGAGEKAFVAGADISELAVLSPDRSARITRCAGRRSSARSKPAASPSVAAVNGFALGGGLELAMACTVRFASENARLGQPEVKLGIIPGYGGTQRLPRLVGRGRALEMLLSGEPVDGRRSASHRAGERRGAAGRVAGVTAAPGCERCWPTGRWRWAWCWKRWTWARCRPGAGLAVRGRGVRSQRGHRRSSRRHARVSRKEEAGLCGKVKHVESIEGQLTAAGLRFAIVVSRFNSFITERLLGGAHGRADAHRRPTRT